MSFNYQPLLSSASNLLQKFGQQFTFTRTTVGNFNPATGTTSNSSSTFTKYACLFDYTDNEKANSLVQEGDRRMLAEAYDYIVNDKVTVGSDVYRVISISDIQPGATKMAVNLQIRK